MDNDHGIITKFIQVGFSPSRERIKFVYIEWNNSIIMEDNLPQMLTPKGRDLVKVNFFNEHKDCLIANNWILKELSKKELRDDKSAAIMDKKDLEAIVEWEKIKEVAKWVYSDSKNPQLNLNRTLDKNTDFSTEQLMRFCEAIGITANDYLEWKIKNGQLNICFSGERFIDLVNFVNDLHRQDYLNIGK